MKSRKVGVWPILDLANQIAGGLGFWPVVDNPGMLPEGRF